MRSLAAALGVALGVCILLLAPPPPDPADALVSYRIGDTIVLPDLYELDGSPADLGPHDPAATPVARVIELWSARCPITRGYEARVARLADAYAARGVEVVAITACAMESEDEIRARAARTPAPVHLLVDPGARLARQLRIEKTPHFVVVDRAGTLVYSGAFDSNLVDTKRPRRTYVRDALDALLTGRQVTTPQTRAFGTLVGWRTEPPAACR